MTAVGRLLRAITLEWRARYHAWRIDRHHEALQRCRDVADRQASDE